MAAPNTTSTHCRCGEAAAITYAFFSHLHDELLLEKS